VQGEEIYPYYRLLRLDFSIFVPPSNFLNAIEQMILGQLTEEEVHVAASTSYAYWYLKQKGSVSPPTSLQTSSAMREVRRHLVASNGNVRKALDRLQEVCQYRKVCTSQSPTKFSKNVIRTALVS
jgi:hypothetical protein